MGNLHTGIKIIKSKLSGKRIPLFVGWDLTSRCNSDCVYCDVPSQGDISKELDTDQVISIIDQLADMGTERIHFGGGEPLLRQDIGEILKACRKKKIYTAVLTNGMIVPEKLEALAYADMINISLDGPEKIHDSIRKQGSYSAVIKAIETIKKINKGITLNVTLSKANKDHLGFILGFADEHRLLVRFQLITLLLSGNKDIADLLLSKKEQADLFTRILSYKKNKKNILNSYSALKYLRDYPDVIFPGCCAGRIYVRISEDGRLFPCSIMKEKVFTDSFPAAGIKELWESLPLVNCRDCMCTPTLEACLVYNLHAEAIINALLR